MFEHDSDCNRHICIISLICIGLRSIMCSFCVYHLLFQNHWIAIVGCSGRGP